MLAGRKLFMYVNSQWRPRLGALLAVVAGGDFKKVGRREAIYACGFTLAPTPGRLVGRCDRRGL